MTELQVVRNDEFTIVVNLAHPSYARTQYGCVWQAWWSATLGRNRRDEDVVVMDPHGSPLERPDWPRCQVTDSWLWSHHGFTHALMTPDEHHHKESHA